MSPQKKGGTSICRLTGLPLAWRSVTLLFGLFGNRRPRGAAAALAVAAGLLVSLLSAAGAGAQPASEAHTPPPRGN